MENDFNEGETENAYFEEGLTALIEKFEKMGSNSQLEPMSTERKSWPNVDKVEYNPASQPILPRCSYVDDLYLYAYTAIQHYNLNHQDDHVELVDPLSLQSFLTSDWRVGQIRHLGFIARSKKSPSKLKLFFAEFGSRMVVKICTPIDPGNPLVKIGCGACHPHGVIYHPFMNYDCLSCGGARRLSTCDASAKRFFSEAYTIKSTVEDLGIEDAKELEKTINGHAMKALKKFNFENDASYDLLELLSCTRFVCKTVSSGGIFWAHLTFVAEVKDRTDTAVHFFAEVGFDVDIVTTCVTIPSIGDSVLLSGYESRCAVCRDVCPMFHPVGRYVAGNYGGTFADSLHNGNFRAVKSELLQKDDAASHTARHEFYESLED